MRMTPFAACVPYNVAADGPFTISMLSISSGSMSFRNDGRPPTTYTVPSRRGELVSTLMPST
jgi:hypothetical protein